MNKYQEALHFLSLEEDCNDTECKGCSIKEICHKYSAINILQELVDKANKYDKKETPKKPIEGKIIYNSFENIQTYHCSCGRELSFADNYCGKCGTKIDWNEVKNNERS